MISASAASTSARIRCRYRFSSPLKRISDRASMAMASKAAFWAPALPMATVPTGMPAGIWTVESRESSPPRSEVVIGTPITGRVVREASTPARWAALPAAAMITWMPRSSAPVAKAWALSGVRWAEMTRASQATPNSVRTRTALLHDFVIGFAPHDDGHPGDDLTFLLIYGLIHRTDFLLSFPNTPSYTIMICRILFTGQAHQGFLVFFRCLAEDLLGEPRRRRLLVPVYPFQVVAYELLVETGRRGSGPVRFGRPEPGRIRGEDLVDQNQFAVQYAEFELRVRDDDAALLGIAGGKGVELQTDVAHLFGGFLPDQGRRLFKGDVFVVHPGLGLGGGRENRLGQPVRLDQPFRLRDAADAPVSRYSFHPEPARYPRTMASMGNGSALLTSTARWANCSLRHRPSSTQPSRSGSVSAMWLAISSLVLSNQKLDRLVRILPLSGYGVRQDVIEGRDAVAGHDQQVMIVGGVDIPDLPLA